MKKGLMRNSLAIIGVLASIFVGSGAGYASVSLDQEYPGYSWYIPSYEVNMKLRKDAVLEVEERIVADFSNVSRRGIIREIPYRYPVEWGGQTRVTPITFKRVENFDGIDWEYTAYKYGDYQNLRIGNVDTYYSEPLNYEFEYEVENLINSFSENKETLGPLREGNGSIRDELFWNAIGTEWDESPIGYYEVNLDMSEFSDDEIYLVECFVGEFGSTDNCELEKNGPIYTASGPLLGYQEGVTFDVEVKGGVMVPNWSWSVFMYDLVKLLYLVPLMIFFGCYVWWRVYGKDFANKTIIPTYKLDQNLRAMEVGALVDERFNSEDVTAGLIDLAVKGYIEIKEIPKKGLFGSKSFDFIKKKDADDDLMSFEKKLLDGLLGKSKKINSKDLEGVFYITVNSVKKKIFDYLVDQKYYVKNPNAVFWKYVMAGIIVMFAGIWVSGFTESWYPLPFVISFALGMCVIAPFMSKKTKYGVEMYSHILGFKEFIKVAEKDRIEFFQKYKDELSQEDQIRTFEKLLPFAVALGMGDKWSDMFGDMLADYNYSPVWYSGRNNFHMNDLSRGLNDMSKSVSAAAAPPANTGSSGGSYGGGGFSGGGFGGGGGGSW